MGRGTFLAARSALPRADVLATVASEDIEATFARLGPGETNGLVDLVEREVLGIAREPSKASLPRRGLIARLFGRERP